MKLSALPLSLVLVVAAFGAPAIAEEDTAATGAVACLRLTSETPLSNVEPVEFGRLLIEEAIQVEVLEAAACAYQEPVVEEWATAGTPYLKFVAHGAGAVVELAALSERHQGAETLRQVDAAATSLAAWAKQQRKWLDKHRPQACYEAVHKQWRRGVVQVRRGAKAVRKAIRTLTPAPMHRAVRQLAAGAENLVEVDLDAVGEACAEVR